MVGIILMLVLVGVILYFVETYVPMSAPIKTLLRIVVIICVVLWLIQLFGIDIPMPRVGGR